MTSITLAEAQSQFAALITRAQAGETIAITRDGETIATLAPPQSPRQPVDLQRLQAFTSQMRPQTDNAGELVRQMRDEARY
ncbi:MAG: type II toxin-antitoxin system Phd/YefM family antitoxin [Sandarakinorhabdus sp.]|jgi:antitoxin (DNA-binding transcriptional repressor) of toxin-antitoxin stability system